MGNQQDKLPRPGRFNLVTPDGDEIQLDITDLEYKGQRWRYLHIRRGTRRLSFTTSFRNGSFYWENNEPRISMKIGFKPMVGNVQTGNCFGGYDAEVQRI